MKNALLYLGFAMLSLATNAQTLVDSFDINPGSMSSMPTTLTAHGDDLYFIGFDHFTYEVQLGAFYKNGLTPQFLSNFDISTPIDWNSLQVRNAKLQVIDSVMYLPVEHSKTGPKLLCYNLGNNTFAIIDIQLGEISSVPRDMYAYNNILYFSSGELCSYAPATNVMKRLTNIPPSRIFPRNITAYNNKLYFCAVDTAHGYELYEYDIASGSAKIAADIYPGVPSSIPDNLCELNGKLYFTATSATNGVQLMVYDGISTPQAIPLPGDTKLPTAFKKPVVFNNKLYFTRTPNSSSELEIFCYDPVTDTVTKAIVAHAYENQDELMVWNDAIYFVANDEIYRYDGINHPTVITDLSGNGNGRDIKNLTATSDALFFSSSSNAIGIELFRLKHNTTTVENLSFKAEVTVYPNPTADVAHLQMNLQENQSLTVTVTDMNGRSVYTTGNVLYSAATHTVNIPMRSLPAGTYTYHISNAQGSLMNSGKLQKL